MQGGATSGTMTNAKATATCEPVKMNAEDVLFILYTSGSTGSEGRGFIRPAVICLHTALTHKFIFDIHENDV